MFKKNALKTENEKNRKIKEQCSLNAIKSSLSTIHPGLIFSTLSLCINVGMQVNFENKKNSEILESIVNNNNLHLLTKIILLQKLLIPLKNTIYSLLKNYNIKNSHTYIFISKNKATNWKIETVIKSKANNQKLMFEILEKASIKGNYLDVIKIVPLFFNDILSKKNITKVFDIIFKNIYQQLQTIKEHVFIPKQLINIGKTIDVIMKLGFSKYITYSSNPETKNFLEKIIITLRDYSNNKIIYAYLESITFNIIKQFINETLTLHSLHRIQETSKEPLPSLNNIILNSTLPFVDENLEAKLSRSNKHFLRILNSIIKTTAYKNFEPFKITALLNEIPKSLNKTNIQNSFNTMMLRYIPLLIELFKLNQKRTIDNVVLVGPGATQIINGYDRQEHLFPEQLLELLFLLPNTRFIVIEPNSKIIDVIKSNKMVPEEYSKLLTGALKVQDFCYKNTEQAKVFVQAIKQIRKGFKKLSSKEVLPNIIPLQCKFLQFMQNYSKLINTLRLQHTVFISTKALMYALLTNAQTTETILSMRKLLENFSKAYIDIITYKKLKQSDPETLKHCFKDPIIFSPPLKLASKEDRLKCLKATSSYQDAKYTSELIKHVKDNPNNINFYNLHTLKIETYFDIITGKKISDEEFKQKQHRENYCINCDDIICLEPKEEKNKLPI